MAHYAFLNENNIVTEVITGVDETELIEGLSPEEWYGNFRSQRCIRTSYNNTIRGIFAGTGYLYDEEKDIFLCAEPDTTDFQLSWMGWYKQNNPSIMIDAAPRSANRWLSIVLNKAFPSAFMRWGYQYPHNPKTFEMSKGNFDVLATIIRNPIDSIASYVVYENLSNDEDILKSIDILIETLTNTKENKEFIDIFSFEDVTNNIIDVVEYIGNKLNVDPQNLDLEEIENTVREQYGTPGLSKHYVLPIDNQENLELTKLKLNDSIFQDKINQANELYNYLLDYTW